MNQYEQELGLGQQLWVLESANFEPNKQLAFGWLFIIAPYTLLTSPKKYDTAGYGKIEVAGLVRDLAHIGSLTNFQRSFPALHVILL